MTGGTIHVLDFEGSSLHGYPIEVGVASWDATTGTVIVRSTLVRPSAEWSEAEWEWDEVAEALHGLSPHDLRGGAHPRDAMVALNALVDREAFCDALGYDEAFLRRLAEAGGVEPTFALRGTRALCDAVGLDEGGRRTMEALLSEGVAAEPAHRAGEDALGIVLAAAAASGAAPPSARNQAWESRPASG